MRIFASSVSSEQGSAFQVQRRSSGKQEDLVEEEQQAQGRRDERTAFIKTGRGEFAIVQNKTITVANWINMKGDAEMREKR